MCVWEKESKRNKKQSYGKERLAVGNFAQAANERTHMCQPEGEDWLT